MKQLIVSTFLLFNATVAYSADAPPDVQVASVDEPTHCPAIFMKTDAEGIVIDIELQDQWGYRTNNSPDEMTENWVQMQYMRKIMEHRPTVYLDGHWIDGSPCNV